MKKQILKLFHKFKLCPKLKHPWGYNCNKYKINKNIICPYFKSKDNREFLNQLSFKTNSTNAYKLIYDSYLLNIDFLDYNYNNKIYEDYFKKISFIIISKKFLRLFNYK